MEKIILSGMERAWLVCKFSGRYPNRGISICRLNLKGFVWEDETSPSIASMLFRTNSCKPSNCHKISPLWYNGLKFSRIVNFLTLFFISCGNSAPVSRLDDELRKIYLERAYRNASIQSVPNSAFVRHWSELKCVFSLIETCSFHYWNSFSSSFKFYGN